MLTFIYFNKNIDGTTGLDVGAEKEVGPGGEGAARDGHVVKAEKRVTVDEDDIGKVSLVGSIFLEPDPASSKTLVVVVLVETTLSC
jgi:hypothetical protein